MLPPGVPNARGQAVMDQTTADIAAQRQQASEEFANPSFRPLRPSLAPDFSQANPQPMIPDALQGGLDQTVNQERMRRMIEKMIIDQMMQMKPLQGI